MKQLCVIVLCLIVIKCADGTFRLREKYNWKQLDYEYPNEYERQQALESGELQPENLLPLGMGYFREKIFVSIPRIREGVPATLTYIDTNKTPSGSPKLIPYPSWAGNKFGDCENGLQYVFRLNVDKCNRLWVLDAGYSGFFTNRSQVCPLAINVFDLNTNVRIRRYILDPEDIPLATVVTNIAVDVGKNCDDTYAYLADPMTFAIIVYSLENNEAWRFHHAYFYPDPLNADFNVDTFNYQWQIGVHSMSISELKPDGYRTLYFTPITTLRTFNVSTRILRDKSRVADSYHDFNVMNERGAYGHISSQAIDEATGVKLFSLTDEPAIACWHTSYPYSPENFDVVDYDENLIFQTDLKIDENRDVWVFTIPLQRNFLARLNSSEINFRIYTGPVDELIDDTRCDLWPKASIYNRHGYYPQTDRSIRKTIVNEEHTWQHATDVPGWSAYPDWWTETLWDRN